MAEEQVQETKEAPKKKKGSFKMVLIVLVALGLAGGAGYYLYGNVLLRGHIQAHAESKAPPPPPSPPKEEPRQEASAEAHKEMGPIVSLDPFVMNIAGTPSRYVKISIALEVKDAKGEEHIKKVTPAIRDAMLKVLGVKPPEAFTDVNGRDAIKKELFNGVDSLFARGDLKAVYVTDIIVQ